MPTLTTVLATAILAFVALIPLIGLRLRSILNPGRPKQQRKSRQNATNPTHLLVVLGSGGHTAEMIAMLQRSLTDPDPKLRLNWKDFTHRTWVASSGDSISADRGVAFEKFAAGQYASKGENAKESKKELGTYEVLIVPRAREIHQSALSAPLSCLNCMFACMTVLARRDFPDVILCNGPATAAIMVFTSLLLRFFDVRNCNSRGKMRTVYVESWARVKKLSLSGKLLGRVVDRFLVQWPQLERSAGGKGEYIGVLV